VSVILRNGKINLSTRLKIFFEISDVELATLGKPLKEILPNFNSGVHP